MDWRLKCALHWCISAAPSRVGDSLQVWLQKLNGSYWPSEERICAMKKLARIHADALEDRYSTVYEFGAGWDLIQPLMLWSFGFQHQVLYDIRPLARLELINAVAKHFGLRPFHTFDCLRWQCIRYCAPADARRTEFPDGCINSIVSTDTLEHIPVSDLKAIFKECRRILRGKMSLIVDTQDHYSYGDCRIARDNFHRFSNWQWRLLNPPTHFQNRLPATAYPPMLEEAGFCIESVKQIEGFGSTHIVCS